MIRQIYVEKEKVKLLFAEDADRKLIYNMAFEDKTLSQDFMPCPEDFCWEELRDEEDCFFGSTEGRSKYLLIEYEQTIIGTISHTYHDGEIKCMELDIWLRNAKYTSKGIGSSVMKLLIESLSKQYHIKTFIIRPWAKNYRAIKAYEKCGFRKVENFDVCRYYDKKYLQQYGDGDCGEDETVNMIVEI